MTNLYFQSASFVYMTIVLILFYSKKRVLNIETKLFSIISIINILGIILDLVIVYLSYVVPFHSSLYILNKFYLLYILYWAAFFTIYIANISIGDKKKMLTILQYIILIMCVISSIFIFILPIELINDLTIMYTDGPSVKFLYAMCAIFVVFIVILSLLNVKKIVTRKYIPIYALLFLSIVAFIVRFLDPAILLTTSIITVINVLLYHTIENPDVKMLREASLARDQAEKANLAKTDFLSSMSHEIRTPLNAIKSFTQFALEATDPKEKDDNLEEVLKGSDILLEIVNGVLDISKIESGNMEIINTDYNPVELFNNTCKLVNVRIKEKNLNFKINIAQDIPTTLYGDKSKIQQILMNLLTNAAKYTNEGTVTLNVQCVNKNNVCSMIIAVEDTGRGIKPEAIHKLFTKFNRLEEDRNTTTEGTGLGLAITKQLIEMMGGKVAVQSVYGSGSKFTVQINQVIKNPHPNTIAIFVPDKKVEIEVPVQKSEGITIENKETEEIQQEKIVDELTDYSGKRILVVDDNKLNLKVARMFLIKYNVDIVLCETPAEVLDRINKGEKYDMILSDEMMPKMSGTEMMQKLKKEGYTTPIVVLTANAKIGDKEKYIESGFDDYIAKPIDKNILDTVFEKFLSNGTSMTLETEFIDQTQLLNNPLINEMPVQQSNQLNNKGNIDYLKENGADISKALEVLGDMEMYDDTMKLFYEEIFLKLEKIDNFKNNADMSNYAIEVHSLKSDLKYLGFYDLADIPYKHELASKENNIEFVKQNYDELINVSNKAINICKEYLGK